MVDVALRYIFNQPLAYSYELIESVLCLVVFFGIAICTARKGHVDIGIIVERFPQRVQAAISSFYYFLSTVLFGVIAWQMFAQTIQTQQMGKVTAILRIPYYPFVGVVALCSVLIALLLLSQLVHFFSKAVSE